MKSGSYGHYNTTLSLEILHPVPDEKVLRLLRNGSPARVLGLFLFMNLFSFIFSLVGGVIVAVTLPWGELAAMQDPEQMQAILFTRIASFFFITQIVLLVLYLPTLGVTIRRLRDAGFNTAWGYGYLGLGVIIFLNWAILERFQYPGGTATQFLGIISTAYGLLLLILACFPTRPAVESTPE